MVICQSEGCVKNKEPMKYEELLKHASSCPPKEAECTLGCGHRLTSADFDEQCQDHFEACPSAFMKCELCNEVFERSSQTEHDNTQCPEVSIRCPLCQQEMTRKIFSMHISHTCLKKEIQCEDCLEKFVREDIHQHSEVCTHKVIDCHRCNTQFKRNQKDGHDCIQNLKSRISTLEVSATQFKE